MEEVVLFKDYLDFLITFIVPGIISYSVWKLVYPTEKVMYKEMLLDVFTYGFINYSLYMTILLFFDNKMILILFRYITPILLTIIYIMFIRLFSYLGFILSPHPNSWDYYFSLRKSCFILITFNNDEKIGGYYGKNSYTSSYPYPQDIYIEKIYSIDEQGNFDQEITSTNGAYIKMENIKLVEFFKLNEIGERKNGDKNEK